MKRFWFKSDLTAEEKKLRKRNRILAVASGVALGVAFPPIPIPYTIFFALVPYFFAIEKIERLIDLNRLTYLTAFVFGVIAIFWVGGWEAATDPFLMVGGTLLLFINPVFFLIPSTLLYFSRKVFGNRISLALLPLFWVSYEYAYMITDASFPWLTLGNALPYFTTFIQIADIAGVLGLSLLILYVNYFLYIALKNRRDNKKRSYTNLAYAALVFLIPLTYGAYQLNFYKVSDKKIEVGLVQPNLNPWDKWEAGNLIEQTELYMRLSKRAAKDGAQLIIWPETALPVYLMSRGYEGIKERIHNFVDSTGIFLLTGMPDIRFYYDEETTPPDAKIREGADYKYTNYNGALFFSPGTKSIGRYGKMKLVPFGERVPFVDALPFLGELIKWEVGISGWNVGRDTSLFNFSVQSDSLTSDTIDLHPLICYESVYPVFTAAFVQKGSNLISVITNDSWYGRLSGPYQHKEIAVLRAVENRRSVARAANGGISCLIDPLGRTTKETELYVRTVLTGEVSLQSEMTFFAKYPRLIPFFSFIASFLVIILFVSIKIKSIFSNKKE